MIALWFGCEGHPGHYYHPSRVGGRRAEEVSPWGRAIDSGEFYPGPDGVARLHHKDGWTALQFGDRTGDSRGGSHTAFLFDAMLTFDEALGVARAFWPRLFERFTFEVVPEPATTSSREPTS